MSDRMPTGQAVDTALPLVGRAEATVKTAAKRGGSALGRRQGSWLFMLPALLIYLFVVVWPSLQGAALSLTNWNGIRPSNDFVGLENFQRAFDDPRMWAALRNTVVLALVITVVQTILGLLFALGANSLIKSKNVIRVIMFAPVVVTPVATGFLFKNIFGATGALNTFLENVGLASWTQEWLGDSDLALWMVCVVILWQYTGYAMVIFLANLQGVPGELIEAAAIDGAGPVRRFWSIVRPHLAPAFAINIMLAIIGSLKQFDQVWVMTAGGPNGATETMSTLLYRVAFQYGQMSYGITIAVILTAVVLVFAVLQNRAVAWQTRESR